MALSFDKFRLQALLRITALLLSHATKNSSRLQTMVKDEDFVFQIQTEAGSGGHFVLSHGALSYHAGLHSQPDYAQIWKTPGDALRVMTSADESDLMRAFNDGLCRMQGRFNVALWLNEAIKIARPKKGRKS
jgi:hypothetical protein